ncbi:hypothetical protein AB3329_01795 [Streptococcus sp. H31]|uniref:hypothetical protein n=1 Tax=Streptococcus huangxiaojuni TaxID=3237239 RepID=UPI0034A201C7
MIELYNHLFFSGILFLILIGVPLVFGSFLDMKMLIEKRKYKGRKGSLLFQRMKRKGELDDFGMARFSIIFLFFFFWLGLVLSLFRLFFW